MVSQTAIARFSLSFCACFWHVESWRAWPLFFSFVLLLRREYAIAATLPCLLSTSLPCLPLPCFTVMIFLIPSPACSASPLLQRHCGRSPSNSSVSLDSEGVSIVRRPPRLQPDSSVCVYVPICLVCPLVMAVPCHCRSCHCLCTYLSQALTPLVMVGPCHCPSCHLQWCPEPASFMSFLVHGRSCPCYSALILAFRLVLHTLALH